LAAARGALVDANQLLQAALDRAEMEHDGATAAAARARLAAAPIS
jgi:hypothetical protein